MSVNPEEEEEEDESAARGTHSFRVTATILLSSLLISVATQICPDLFSGSGRLNAYATLWPQSGRFFTGLTEQDSIAIYKLAGGDWDLRRASRPAEDERFLGLNRIANNEFLLGSFLADRVPDAFWRTCQKKELIDCSTDLDPPAVFEVRGLSIPNTWCGAAVIVRARPPEHVVRKIALVDLACAG
ncbi:hypothetical protein [Actinoplanes regularis]|uniref:hypothetical protein n=1 Tax=Actinoplanes regularis TaxID=52697 RepID=UPI0011783CD8|nr:hypothetical protein [Actinoplanes regularis]